MALTGMVLAHCIVPEAHGADAPEERILGIAQVSDPPPAINGDLERLGKLVGWTRIEAPANVVFGANRWKNASDLSGSVVVGWDVNNLYVAARIRDNAIVQPLSGEMLWKGDHLILLLDAPRQEGTREKKKIFQIGLSPGNLITGPGAIAPEVYQWTPVPRSMTGAKIAARRTPSGYQIETAIPWSVLGIPEAHRGMRIGYDVMLSDSDSAADPDQDKVMSLLTSPWDLRNPGRLVEGVLATAEGKIDRSLIKSPFELIRSNIRIPQSTKINVDAASADKVAARELVVRARIDFPTVAGGNPMLAIRVNGTLMTFDRVRNRLMRMDLGNRQQATFLQGNSAWFILYAPNYDPIPEFSDYATPGVNPFELRFDIGDVWKPAGGNVIELENISTLEQPLVVEVGISQRLSAKMTEPELKPAPTGEIPTIIPNTSAKPNYTYRQLPGGAIEVRMAGHRWIIESDYSTRAPGWANLGEGTQAASPWKTLRLEGAKLSGTTGEFELHREIIRHDDRIRVIDRITNTTGDDLPVLFRHQTRVNRSDGTLYLGGLPVPQPVLSSMNGAVPTTLMMMKDHGIGMVAEDDVMRAQCLNFADNDLIGIRDDNLVVAKDKTIELEYSVYPIDSADRFEFINRIRRNWDVNFTIDGSESMISSYGQVMNTEMTDELLIANLRNRSAKYAINTIWNFNFDGRPTELTPVNVGKQKMIDRVKAVCPDVQNVVYFHCFAGYQDPRDWALFPDTAQWEKQTFAADVILRPDGSAADYSNPQMPLFLPTEGSAWGSAMEKLLDYRVKATRADGYFWDELEYSAYKYDYNPNHWDGVSGEIDLTTHRLLRKFTNVTLASQPWRLRMARTLLERGSLLGNGAPMTRSFGKLHFPRFVETAAITNLAYSQLYTPIALGDHLTERNQVDCYRNMVRGLDYGAVYYWYHTEIDVTHPTLTSFMFPITPINLGHGYLIGKERILTNTSGYFGWDDRSDFDIVVFDDRGNRTEQVKIPKIERDGKRFAEVRIPEGYAVALIRR
jgi:hypothetical protein